MFSQFSSLYKSPWFFPIVLGIIGFVGSAGAGAYQWKVNQSLHGRLDQMAAQMQVLTKTLAQQSNLSAADKQQLQEMANRGTLLASAQAPSLTSAVAKVTPAVVSVVVSRDVPQFEVSYENPFGNDPFFGDVGIRVPVYKPTGNTTRQEIGAGSGFIVRSDGYILTNRHVVEDTKAYYTVLLSSGDQKSATVVYRDPERDVAILKIEGSGYPTVSLGNSANLQLGQSVAAIGNALGEYNNSVSVGVISGLNRTVEASDRRGNTEVLKGVIQTDAAINPGNSGGPLLDLNGNVIGVNVAQAAGAQSVGFAIPINDVKALLTAQLR